MSAAASPDLLSHLCSQKLLLAGALGSSPAGQLAILQTHSTFLHLPSLLSKAHPSIQANFSPGRSFASSPGPQGLPVQPTVLWGSPESVRQSVSGGGQCLPWLPLLSGFKEFKYFHL